MPSRSNPTQNLSSHMFKNINILRPILASLIIFIPLYPKFPLLNVSGTYVAIRLDDIIVSLALVAYLIHQSKNHFPILKQPITKLFLAYFIAITISAINAILVYQTEPANIILLHTLRRVEYMSLFFITISSIQTKTDLKFPYLSLLFASLFVSIYGYGQKYFGLPIISTMNEEFSKGQLLELDFWSRISSTFAGHYDLAAFASVALIIIGSIFILTKNRLAKITSLVVFLLLFHILTLTASRVSTFAFWGGMSLTIIMIRKYLYIIPVSLLMLTSITFSQDLNQRLLATIPTIKLPQINISQKKPEPTSVPTATPTLTAKVSTTTVPVKITTPQPTPTATPTIIRHQPSPFPEVDADVGVARSGEIRFNAEWPRAVTAYRKNPLIGTGLGSITLATDNDYLRLLGESGLIGFITFLIIPLYLAIQTLPFLFKKSPNNYQLLSLVFLGASLTMLTNATLIDVFEASKVAYLYWIMVGIYYQTLRFAKK